MLARMPLQLALLVAVLVASFMDRADLVAENMALRHQLSCLKHRKTRPRLRPLDRVRWVLLAGSWGRWKDALVMVKPGIVGWHRRAFKLLWTWKSRRRGC